MKALLLSSACCIHTRKWCNGLVEKGIEVHLVSQQEPMDGYNKNVIFHKLPYSGLKGYILNRHALIKTIRKINPDVINVHYASGYGTLATVSGVRNFILSVWGSDVYDFPFKSKLHYKLVSNNLNRAKIICSTSEVMGRFVKDNFSINPGIPIEITPFGVDVFKFKKIERNLTTDTLTIGTVKTLRPKYGIDNLIRAFSILINRGYENIELKIAGKGFLLADLQALATELGVKDKVQFLGWVENNQVPNLLNTFDIYVAPSTLDSESFGVAIVEASACNLPVIVTNVGGLPEVVINDVTGIVVKPDSVELLSDAIEKLLKNSGLRHAMGEAGRENVLAKYDWDSCVRKMINIYSSVAH